MSIFFLDTWVQDDSEPDKDVISRSEAEALSSLIGAVAYFETSAIEQTGLYECFTKAVSMPVFLNIIYQTKHGSFSNYVDRAKFNKMAFRVNETIIRQIFSLLCIFLSPLYLA